MIVSLVVAMAENRIIGAGGRLPWHLPADLRRFRALTLGRPVIMGRHTWESIGRPLPQRRNIVLSRDPAFAAPGCVCVPSLEAAWAACDGAPEAMIIGGAGVYAAALPAAGRIHLTLVHARPSGDTRFPELAAGEWRECAREEHAADAANAYAMSFLTLERTAPPGAAAGG